MLPAAAGYDRAITVFSPDGRLYQVEYAIETVRRGTLAIGVKSTDGVILAVEEKTRKLQISNVTQKIFQVDDHIGVAAAGYIPDARTQVDHARFFAQSNRLIYDEPVDVEGVASCEADQRHDHAEQLAHGRHFVVAEELHFGRAAARLGWRGTSRRKERHHETQGEASGGLPSGAGTVACCAPSPR